MYVERRYTMIQSNEVSQAPVAHGQVLAGIGILVGLALFAPLLGLVMLPGVALSGFARAVSER
jgi:hypothetical protein